MTTNELRERLSGPAAPFPSAPLSAAVKPDASRRSGGLLQMASATLGAAAVALAAPLILLVIALPIVLGVRAVVEAVLWLMGGN